MKRALIVPIAIAGLLTALAASAQFRKPEEAVEYRQAGMTLIGHHFGLIGAMVQGKVPYDAAAAAANADLVVTLSKLPFSGFIDGTASTEKGGAKASIWTERSKFDADAKTMQDALVKLAEASKTNDLAQLKAAFGPAGKSCKSCHDDYRNH